MLGSECVNEIRSSRPIEGALRILNPYTKSSKGSSMHAGGMRFFIVAERCLAAIPTRTGLASAKFGQVALKS